LTHSRISLSRLVRKGIPRLIFELMDTWMPQASGGDDLTCPTGLAGPARLNVNGGIVGV
jgi:hypothetical protein